MRTTALCAVALILAGCLFRSPQQRTAPATSGTPSPTFSTSRMLNPEDELSKAYHETYRSIEAAEQFIREYPNERDLCAGALLNIAALQAREDKKKAIESYQKAIEEYGDEIVPCKNADITVANWALLSIARLQREVGNREKALEIFAHLMASSDSNTRTTSRIEYLATKQSHLKVVAEVAVQSKGPFSIGSRIPVVVWIRNPTDEAATFKCYASIKHRSHRALAPRGGCEEIIVVPGERREVLMEFTERDTKGLVPGVYELKADLTGVPFDTSTERVEIRK